jgi:acetyl esterase/lipase
VRKVVVLSAAATIACSAWGTVPAHGAAATLREPVVTVTVGGQVGTAEAFIVTLPPLRTETYSYGARDDQKIDAYWRTPERGAQPAILLLHGGYWLEGDKSSWRNVARRLAGRGYAVFAADYRLSGAAPWPAQRDDAEAALAFLKRHAGRFNVDPSRVVVLGSSAGGHLATTLGTYGAGAQRVRGVIALSPVNSPYLGYVDGASPAATRAEEKLRRAVVQLVGCDPQAGDLTCWERMDDVAPATHADAGDAPILIMHSADEFVPAKHSTELVTALKARGVAAVMEVVPGSTHGAGIIHNPQAWDKIVSWMDSVAKPVAGADPTATPTAESSPSATPTP